MKPRDDGARHRRLGTILRWAVVVAAWPIGAFAALACLLGIAFADFKEIDPQTDWLEIAAYTLGMVVSLAGPGLIWRLLLPRSAPAPWLSVAGAVLITALVVGVALPALR